MSTPSPAAQTKGSETMKRLTSITPEGILFLDASLEKYADADREAIVRLGKIENILGDDYDLDRLRVLVEAADEERVEIKPAPYGDTCGQCVHFHQKIGVRDGICDARSRWYCYDAKTLMESGPKKAKVYLDPFTTTRACDKFEPKIK